MMSRTEGRPVKKTACIAIGDGTVLFGQGFGREGTAVGELCFNTAMTGYQEILTDPSYAGQIITFTFPHIGIVGANADDNESSAPLAEGMIMRCLPTPASNWRSSENLSDWLRRRGQIGVGAVDTRRLTRIIRRLEAPSAAISHRPDGNFDVTALVKSARAFAGLSGNDLAREVSTGNQYDWNQGCWRWSDSSSEGDGRQCRVAAIDYGAKHNILRCLTNLGIEVRVFPATAAASEILAWKPDGIFLSNGPGDPAATAEHAVPTIREFIERTELPIFGICLGHQLLALAIGGQTVKMSHGHHGANHPVMDTETQRVEITSMNHGFAVDRASLPSDAVETHRSLFDGSNCGIRLKERPIFSVQYHPEASPGPHDSHYLFKRFLRAMEVPDKKGSMTA